MASRKYENLKRKKDIAISELKNETAKLDIVSQEAKRVSEISKNASIIISDIDRQFEQATKLTGVDICFLFFATALQCIRQYLLTPFKERLNDKDSAIDAHKEEKEIFGKYNDKDKSRKYGYYFASKTDIMTKGVPYDTQFGSADFDLGLSGNAHRFRTLGHDPLLGWVFGTGNIMTNTLTSWTFESYHIKLGEMANGRLKSKIVSRADTLKIFEYASKRLQDDPVVLAMALIKQRLHLKSDMFSTVGLPIPSVSVLSPDMAQSLAEYGIDIANIQTIGKQATYAAFINMVIAIIHGFFYDKAIGSKKIYEVRTRKVLSYSNLIASASNLIGVAIAETVAVSTNNIQLGGDAIRYLDIGGLAVTIYRLVNDKKFIQQIKHEFLEKEFYDMVMGKEIQ